jgi:hypothetical protein
MLADHEGRIIVTKMNQNIEKITTSTILFFAMENSFAEKLKHDI